MSSSRRRRVEDVWTEENHPWSAWVKRPLFASLEDRDDEVVRGAEGDNVYRSELAPWASKAPTWLSLDDASSSALIIDLAGVHAIEMGLAFGLLGFRPVLLMNATSDSREVIDMSNVLRLLEEGARFPRSFPHGPNVRPAFLLDSRREGGDAADLTGGRFDNRWTVFPSDLPSSEQLKAANIRSIVIVQDGFALREDVQAIAWTYQKGGLEIRIASTRDQKTNTLTDKPPSWFTLFTQRLRRRASSFRRRSDGAYGHRVPVPPEPSHG